MKNVRLSGLCGLFLAAVAVAQEPAAPASTAQPGQAIPSTFRAFIVVDDRFPPKKNPPMSADDRDPRDRTGKLHCPVCEDGLSPVVAVFVRADAKDLKPDAGVGKLAKAVNEKIPEYRADRLASFVTFLKLEGMPKNVTVKDAAGGEMFVELDAEYPDDEKRDVYASEIRDFANGVKAPNVVFGLAAGKSKSAEAWGLKDEDEVTVIIYNRLRVAKRWTFKAADGPTDEQIAEIIAATEEMITGMAKK